MLAGGGATTAVVVVDQAKLEAAVQGLAATFDRPAADAALAYAGTEVKQTPAQAGITVQQAAAATVIEESFLASSAAVPLPADVVQPEITDEEADQVADNFAEAGRVGAGQGEGGRGRHLQGQPGHDRRGPDLRAGERHAGPEPRRREVAGAAPTPRSRRSS